MDILGIDLAKLTFDATLQTSAGTQHYHSFPNTPEGFMQLQAWLTQQDVKELHACMEATNIYWEALATFLHEAGYKASLDAHAAARDVRADTAVRFAARAAGQAVASAHVARHAYGSAIYAQQAIYRATHPAEANAAAARERGWQYHHLLQLRENKP